VEPSLGLGGGTARGEEQFAVEPMELGVMEGLSGVARHRETACHRCARVAELSHGSLGFGKKPDEQGRGCLNARLTREREALHDFSQPSGVASRHRRPAMRAPRRATTES